VTSEATTVVARPRPQAREEPTELPFGAQIGRYLVLSVLGRGGMGVVYAVYDPTLDRKIAVKLLRFQVSDGETEGRARMQREAQALGRLNHGNVITVHDVGEYEGAMYIAMELVEGGTLREWQDAPARTWREIIETYLAAARGVAAAHAASLVHRDLKPENVLIGSDGRVRVTDFGLARLGVLQHADPREAALSPSPSHTTTGNLTLAGVVMGTPFYMAPEQIDGGIVDARSDQFAFCIALWEALYKEQPFPGTNLALRSAAMKAEPPALPTKTEVPRAVGRALLRGLAPEPDDRWPSLDALATELRAAMQQPARGGGKRAALAIGLAVVAVLAVVYAIGARAGASKDDGCATAGAAADYLWLPATRDGVARDFAATGVPFAAAASTSVDRRVSEWQHAWRSQIVDSCTATRAGTQSDSMLDLRSACLGRELDDMTAQIAALRNADAALVERAPQLALPDLDACADTSALGGISPAPTTPAVVAAMKSVDARLEALEKESMHGLSLPKARQDIVVASLIVCDASAIGWAPLISRAQLGLANVQAELGLGKPARATLMAAAAGFQSAGDLDGVADADLRLLDIDSDINADYDLAEGWASLASGVLARLGPRVDKELRLNLKLGHVRVRSGHPRRAREPFNTALALAREHGNKLDQLDVLIALGAAEGEAGDEADSRKHEEEALALAHAELGDHHPKVANIEHDLGAASIREGHPADAIVHLTKALALREELLGSDAVETAQTEETLGIAELALDQVDVATAHMEGAIAVLQARLGPNHPDVANALNDVGGAYHRAGMYDRALATAQHTLAMREAALGPDSPDVAQSLVNLAIEAKALERWDLVLPAYTRAIPIFEQTYGPTNFETGVVYLNHAEALRVHGDLDAAAAEYERARVAMVSSLGEATPLLAHVWNGTGQLALARGDSAAAVPLLERAVAIREKDAGDATALAESRFALARALPADAHARAVQLATAARDAYRDAGRPFARERGAVDAWLAQQEHH
jgi:tetratricopeptide (TPR) repeat protein/predicted Ser/Thr protein kinase